MLFFSTNSEHHRQSIRRFQIERSDRLIETPFREGRDERISEEGADVEFLVIRSVFNCSGRGE